MTSIDPTKIGKRTTTLGLFNFARSFWQAGHYLASAQLKTTHPHAPAEMLFCQAIELYLKAFLRLNGYTKAELKKLGHRLAEIVKCSKEHGLTLAQDDEAVITFLANTNAFIDARYIQTGPKQKLPWERISRTCERLDNVVGQVLHQHGEHVRLRAPTL